MSGRLLQAFTTRDSLVAGSSIRIIDEQNPDDSIALEFPNNERKEGIIVAVGEKSLQIVIDEIFLFLEPWKSGDDPLGEYNDTVSDWTVIE